MNGNERAYCRYMVPFGLTVPFVIFFGILKNTLHDQREGAPFKWSLGRTRKTLACICYTGNIGCFAALMRVPIGKPWVAFWIVNIMYVLNASFIAGVAVNVIDIGAKYAGSIMAVMNLLQVPVSIFGYHWRVSASKRAYENAFAVLLV